MKYFLALCVLIVGCHGQSKVDIITNNWINSILPNIGSTTTEKQAESTTEGEREPGKCVKLSECMDKNDVDLAKMDVYRQANSCHYMKIYCPISRLIKSDIGTAPVIPPKPMGCGWSNPGAFTFRDSSNEYAQYGEFPWMVAMMRKVNQNQAWDPKDYLAGGTLIHASVVMTVAHRMRNIDNNANLLKCRLGEWDTRTTNELYNHQDKDVRKILVHEEFSLGTSANNVALVFTFSPFDLSNPHVGVACLNFDEPKADATCFSMGWGKDFNDDNKYAVLLKKVPLPIVDRNSCEHSLQGSRLGRFYRLHNTLLCAGGIKGFDTCTGDGGSSLSCHVSSHGAKSRFVVYGMVSFGVECGTSLPAAYVNLKTVVHWIERQFLEENLVVSFKL